MEFAHVPVLYRETIEGLCVRPGGTYVDGTLGGGGHASGIAQILGKDGILIGIDQDEEAIEAAGKRLSGYEADIRIVRDNFRHYRDILAAQHISEVDGILLDLGVSSHQLDDASRGFTYREDAPLDMRMDQRSGKTAADIVNTYSESDLTRVIRDFGEERYARNIARRIVEKRKESAIRTTGELVGIIQASMPAKARWAGGHPAKRTFQALRIELNEELAVLTEALDDMIASLSDGGRICVITFHSLEDRIVKNTFRRQEKPCTCPPDFPVCVCGKKPLGRVITGKPITAGAEEQENNPRAASAKLRIFERRKAD